MSILDEAMLRRFARLVGDRLRGDWVVLGGCVLPLRGVTHRVTLDIDVAGPRDAGTDQTFALLGIARDLGLPVESINLAGALFLRRVPGWETNLVEVHRGRHAAVHVPDATLFLLLKIERLSESDLDDCRAMLRLARREHESVDGGRVRCAIEDALDAGPAPDRRGRLETLLDEIPGVS